VSAATVSSAAASDFFDTTVKTATKLNLKILFSS
jgi:hypothetical protein